MRAAREVFDQRQTRTPHRMKAIVTLDDSETPLDDYQQHKTPRQVAQYFRNEDYEGDGSGVGSEYKTHGDLWGVDNGTVIVGLLHLILDELRESNAVDDEMRRHPYWLVRHRDQIEKLIEEHARECDRIATFCDLEFLKSDVHTKDLHEFSRLFRTDDHAYWDARKDLREKVERLSSVNAIDDIEKLKGIRKKSADRIREKMAKSK